MTCFMNGKLYPFRQLVKLSANSLFSILIFSFKKKLIKSFPSFYEEILLNWKTFFSRTSETPSYIVSQILWYHIYIQIDKANVHLSRFSQNNLNFVSHLFNINDTVKAWHLLKQEYQLNINSYF